MTLKITSTFCKQEIEKFGKKTLVTADLKTNLHFKNFVTKTNITHFRKLRNNKLNQIAFENTYIPCVQQKLYDFPKKEHFKLRLEKNICCNLIGPKEILVTTLVNRLAGQEEVDLVSVCSIVSSHVHDLNKEHFCFDDPQLVEFKEKVINAVLKSSSPVYAIIF